MMFNAAASRRASCALIRSPRTTPTTTASLSRTIAFSTPRRPLQHVTNLQRINLPKQTSIPSSIFPRHGLSSTLQIRSLTYIQRMRLGLKKASKGIWRKNPILFPLAVLSVVGATLFFAYIAYIELTEIAPKYNRFPPPVATALRTAVYYTDVDSNPPRAFKAYKEALHLALEQGMHPFSDEVLGIKLQTSLMLEKAGLMKPAIEVLERTRKECLAWVEQGRKMAAENREGDEKAKKQARIVQRTASSSSAPESRHLDLGDLEDIEQMKAREEYDERQRNKAMKKVVGISMRLAELYSSDHIQDSKKAEEAQIAAVELSLKELQYRQSMGLPVGSGHGDDAWLTQTEIAAALNELGQMYMEKPRPELALPLFLRSADLLRAEEGGNPSCKLVEVTNNIASATGLGAMKEQTRINEGGEMKTNPEDLFKAARQWAQVAIDMSDKVPSSERDELCDSSCASAMYNLALFAEAQGKLEEAEKWLRCAQSRVSDAQVDGGFPDLEKELQRIRKQRSK